MSLFKKAQLELEKIDTKIQVLEIGETFTLAATDNGSIYSWGCNNFYQLGRKESQEIGYLGKAIYFHLIFNFLFI